MDDFDKRIKDMTKEFQIPKSYYKKVDETLESIQNDSIPPSGRGRFLKVAIIMTLVCCLFIGYFCFFNTKRVNANFFETFKQTILEFLGIGDKESEEKGVESERDTAVSKPDLMIELREKVIDSQNMYLVVKITAPTDVEFAENITFDYFGFCKGSNYNTSNLLFGPNDCVLLEVLEEKKNVATYVVSIATDEKIEEDKEYTVFFKDLMQNPYGDNPQMLVEGIWSISFTATYTVTENIRVEGTEQMRYSLLHTTAAVKEIELLPLGMSIVSDVSLVPIDELHTSDTRITIRLKMIDGSELVVDSPDPETDVITSGGSISEYEEGGKVFYKYVSQFESAIEIDKVLGIYIEDCYVPLKANEGEYENE